MLAGTPIVVSAALADQRAGVRRDDEGHLWLAHWGADRPDRVAGADAWHAAPADNGGEHVFCAVCGENDGAVRVFFSATRAD